MAEELRFSLFADDKASGSFLKAGKAAAAASGDVRRLFDSLKSVDGKSAQARLGLLGDKEAQAKLDKIDASLLTLGRRSSKPGISLEGAAKARAEISGLEVQLDKLAAKGAGAEAATGAGGLAGPAGLGALIGAGVALSPILATVGTGLAGFGLAAAGVALPIEKAASKTGGLRANLKLLNPEQRTVANGLLALGQQYSDFQQQLAPDVMGVFNQGLRLAGHVLSDIQPVASATGKALGGVLGQVDAEFQSRNWQNFFTFMAQQAGPDLRLVGSVLTSTLDALPPLLRDLQPLGEELLKTADDAAKLAGGTAKAVGWLQHLQVGSDGAAKKQSLLGKAFHTAAQNSYPELNIFGKVRDLLFGTADAAGKAADKSHGAARGLQAISSQALTAGTSVATLNSDLMHLNNLLSNQSAQVQWKQAQLAANKAVEAGSKALDGNGAKQLANRQLVIRSTQAALQFADQERKTGGNVEGAARTLADQIRFLERTHDKSAWLRGELALLRRALSDIKSEQIKISVHGDGTWNVQGAGVGHGVRPGGPSPSAALGMMVTGGTPGVDSVPILAQRGEVVVPTPMVNAGAVDHLRGRIPGFASGGVVGHYSNGVAAMGSWLRSEDRATIRAVSDSVAAAFKAAKPPPGSIGGGFPGGGSSGPGPAAAQAYALSTLPAYGWGLQQMLPLIALWNGESGWRWNALNGSSGAYGIPQSLPASKMAAAGPDWRTNPATQIRWGLGYIKSVYGSPATAYSDWLGRSPHWYGNGLDAIVRKPTLIGVGERGIEHVQVTPGGRGGGQVVNINVTVSGVPLGHPAQIGGKIAEYLGHYIKNGGKIYAPRGI